MRFKEIKAVCPWSKDYKNWDGGEYSLCEPTAWGGRVKFRRCNWSNCPLYAMDKALTANEKKEGKTCKQ